MDIHFIVSVWGKKYTELFLNFSLLTQLSEGNLGFFYKTSGAHKYKIFTTSGDAKTILKSPAYLRLGEIIQTELHFIDDIMDELYSGRINKYDVMTLCHGRGISDAIKEQAAFICLSSDQIISDGSLANIYRIASNGKRMVVIGDYRVTAETFAPALRDRFYSRHNMSIAISSRDLVKLSLPHIHPNSRTLFWNRDFIQNRWPAFLYWDVEGEGILQRGIHLNPIMINPSKKDELLIPSKGMGIDGYDYMMRVVPDFKDVYLVRDSDEVTFLSLESEIPGWQPTDDKLGVLFIASWVRRYCCKYHVNFLNTKIRFHHTDLSSKWEEVEQESDKAVGSIFKSLEFLNRVPEAQREIEAQIESFNRLNVEKWSLRVDSATTLNVLGEEFYKAGRVKEAEAAFLKALDLTPNSGIIHSNLAVLNWEHGRQKEAIEHLKLAIQLEPNNPDILRNAHTILKMLDELNLQNNCVNIAWES